MVTDLPASRYIIKGVMIVRMPKRSGRDAYLEISKSSPDIPVIFCSGFDPELTQMPQQDRSRFIFKPYDSIDLLNAVRMTLDKASSMKKRKLNSDFTRTAAH